MQDNTLLEWLSDKMFEGVYIVDRQRRIIYWNTGAEEISGYCNQDIMGKRCWDNLLRHVDDNHRELCRGWCPLVATMQDGQEHEADVYLHHKEGHRVPIKVRTVPIRDASNKIIGAIEIFCKNSASTSLEKQTNQPLPLDQLTQVANHFFLENHLKSRLAELRKGDQAFSVISIKIDTIEHIAQTYGADVRDSVLKMIANTLTQNAGVSTTVGRWGSGEFMLVVNGTRQEVLHTLMDKLAFLVDQSFLIIDAQVVRTRVSISMAFAQLDDTVESLLARAETISSGFAGGWL